MNFDDQAAVARAINERNELMRLACVRAIARADAGQAVDDKWIEWARDFVAMTPPLAEPMSDGALTWAGKPEQVAA